MNILQIAGGEGAGKTTLAFRLAEELPGIVSVLTLDRYLRNKRPDDGLDFALQPTSVDWPLVHAHMDALSRGQQVPIPEYSLEAGRRLPGRMPQTGQLTLTPTDILIVDGLHYLQDDFESLKLFLDTPAGVRRDRVRQRDADTGQRLAGLFDTVFEPAYQRHTLPLRDEADLVLDGGSPPDDLVGEAQRWIVSVWGGWG